MALSATRRLDGLLLGQEKRLRVRSRQAMLTFALNVVLSAIALCGAALGLMDPRATCAWVALSLIGPSAFYAAVRSGFSLRFTDPALTLPQGVFSVVSTMVAYVVCGPVRGASLLVLAVALIFGMFALAPRQVRNLSLFAVIALGATMFGAHALAPGRYPAAQELMHFLLLAAVLPSIAVLAGQLSTMRLKLREHRCQLEQALEQNRQLAIRDELTGLYNRRHLVELVSQELLMTQRTARPMCLVLIDIDHFKRINDNHGHSQGDEVLRAFARAARTALRETDTLGRWGGEEFLLMLPDTTVEGAQRVIARVREQLSQVNFERIHPSLRVTFSAGITGCIPGDVLTRAVERADQAMYAAKQGGRDRSVVA
jgi:diguanylate cyclase (GGDEF)-like protein